MATFGEYGLDRLHRMRALKSILNEWRHFFFRIEAIENNRKKYEDKPVQDVALVVLADLYECDVSLEEFFEAVQPVNGLQRLRIESMQEFGLTDPDANPVPQRQLNPNQNQALQREIVEEPKAQLTTTHKFTIPKTGGGEKTHAFTNKGIAKGLIPNRIEIMVTANRTCNPPSCKHKHDEQGHEIFFHDNMPISFVGEKRGVFFKLLGLQIEGSTLKLVCSYRVHDQGSLIKAIVHYEQQDN